ncbi:pentatricopeptide repeat-containing protein at5g66520-like protein [Trifolium pratense]|uniref:Pentatricopeptide repeat-containing protein at5g66520-like protein n=1 Tax=Trifolium pratense TaxID=57577 RepID=A0A2K3PJ54_TRIPR|nr:pentatricopeptide repeat-containing protein at5g66520-like protein [Trifolium pratense]
MTQKPFLTTLAEKCNTLTQLKQLHAHILRCRIQHSPYALAPLLSVAATSFFSYACSIFHNLTHTNTFIHNTMIRAYLQNHSPESALSCYSTMLQNGIPVNNYTFPPLIKSCIALVSSSNWVSSIMIGHMVHCHVVQFGLTNDPYVVSAFIEFYTALRDVRTARVLFDRMTRKDVVLWTAMIDGYGKMGNVENAREMFDEMPERNAVSWSAMMAAYCRVSEFKEVLALFVEMQNKGVKPNDSILVTVLTACAHLGALTQGMWVHSYAKRFERVSSNPILATALVDMYSKCGCVGSALTVFDGISNKDVGAWNAMISGVALNGDARKSLELFQQMIVCGKNPNETTFVAVLTACTHAKMVREGLRLFEEMSGTYGVEPCAEHYACVVDLLSRAGMVEEAERFIEEKMGGFAAGDANVWGAILNACRIYKNINVGNRVWKKLIDMGVADCGTHVLTYNIYRDAGWDAEANRVRSMISEAGMKKKPGCSIIEVGNEVEEFLAGDQSHPQAQEMCRLLDSILKMANLEHF